MSVSLDEAMARVRGTMDAMASCELARLREGMEFRGASDVEIEEELEHWQHILAEWRDDKLAELRAFILHDGQTLQ